MPSLKVLVIDNDYCLDDENTEVCDVNPLAETVETRGWLVEGPAYCYNYPLRQFRRLKHLKVNLIRDLFGALRYKELPSYDGFPNLAATVEAIEFTSRITSSALYYWNWQKSMEELRYTMNMMGECCRKEWRKVPLIGISMLALSYRRECSGYDGLQLLECVKRRFQQELCTELLILIRLKGSRLLCYRPEGLGERCLVHIMDGRRCSGSRELSNQTAAPKLGTARNKA
ncbi:hypothetical protein CMEL01_02904 [Colletotrichum melonis]|uniref:Uncharacterized protein n=1 Tax=Colletotrichum melonis TaxID=1209925 RepID=A0AAI9UK13_9PEZI|nr:hypothetical protein CMEL01_02904 [Colletotrichum melonis]